MINPRDILRLAESLSSAKEEVALRTAAGRAYFAAFHASRDLMDSLGFTPPKAELVHSFVWRRLSCCENSRLGRVGNALQDLRKIRNVADYELRAHFDSHQAAKAVGTSLRILDIIESLTDQERDAAREMIRTYERDVLREPTWRGRPR